MVKSTPPPPCAHVLQHVLQVSLRMWSSSMFVMVNPSLIIWVIFSFLQRVYNVGVSSLGPFPSCVLQLSWQTKINNDDAVYIHSYSTCQVNIEGSLTGVIAVRVNILHFESWGEISFNR